MGWEDHRPQRPRCTRRGLAARAFTPQAVDVPDAAGPAAHHGAQPGGRDEPHRLPRPVALGAGQPEPGGQVGACAGGALRACCGCAHRTAGLTVCCCAMTCSTCVQHSDLRVRLQADRSQGVRAHRQRHGGPQQLVRRTLCARLSAPSDQDLAASVCACGAAGVGARRQNTQSDLSSSVAVGKPSRQMGPWEHTTTRLSLRRPTYFPSNATLTLTQRNAL